MEPLSPLVLYPVKERSIFLYTDTDKGSLYLTALFQKRYGRMQNMRLTAI